MDSRRSVDSWDLTYLFTLFLLATPTEDRWSTGARRPANATRHVAVTPLSHPTDPCHLNACQPPPPPNDEPARPLPGLRAWYGTCSSTLSSAVLQVGPTLHRLVEDIFLTCDTDGSSILDGFTETGIWDQTSICHYKCEKTCYASSAPCYFDRAASDLLSEPTPLRILTCIPGLKRAGLQVPSRITSLGDGTLLLHKNRWSFLNMKRSRQFYAAHCCGCATLSNKHFRNRHWSSGLTYRRTKHTAVVGLEAVVSWGRFRRNSINGESRITMMSLLCRNAVSKMRIIALNVLHAFRTFMMQEETLRNQKKKLKRSNRLLEFREEAWLRNDRGALPRGGAISNAHAQTWIHSVRHRRIWQKSKWQRELRGFFNREGVPQRPKQGRTTLCEHDRPILVYSSRNFLTSLLDTLWCPVLCALSATWGWFVWPLLGFEEMSR